MRPLSLFVICCFFGAASAAIWGSTFSNVAPVRIGLTNRYYWRFNSTTAAYTITFPYSFDVRTLLVAGGGGGGRGTTAGGGGGGGGVMYFAPGSAQEFTYAAGTTYYIKVGAGGVAAAADGIAGSDGQNSSISLANNRVQIAAMGGGGGGGNGNGRDGGCGGGAGGGGLFKGGKGFQGYNGGDSQITSAGGAGGSPVEPGGSSSYLAGYGAQPIFITMVNTGTYFSGGGGGFPVGMGDYKGTSGRGGAYSTTNSYYNYDATSGTPSTGGGGGAGGQGKKAGNGGSGLVMIIASAQCLPGTYLTPAIESYCTICPINTFSNIMDAESCQVCPSGTWTNSKLGQTTCVSRSTQTTTTPPPTPLSTYCQPGNYSSTGSQPCTKCAAGSFTSFTASTSCTLCEAGTYSPAPGSSACMQCEAGTASNSQGSTSCTSCASGLFTISKGSTSCAACPSLF